MIQGKQTTLSRRRFLRSATKAAGFTIVAPQVLAGSGRTPPSERVNIAVIGAGGQGIVNAKELLQFPDVQIVALADPNESSDYSEFYFGGTAGREPARQVIDDYYAQNKPSGTYKGCAAYVDFYEMLEKKSDIDACLVATTDNLHALATMAAIRKGLHVYCEKPLTKTVYEARTVAEAAAKYNVATQMGNQYQASEQTRLLCEWVADGAIGPVRKIQFWTTRPGDVWPQGIGRPTDSPPLPKGLDWDRWLGPARQRPYHPLYHPFKWRGWLDFGTGTLGDIASHLFDAIFRAFKLKAPTSVEACSTELNGETYPLASLLTYEFGARDDMPPLTIKWYDGGLRPTRPDDLEQERTLPKHGAFIRGEKGTILYGLEFIRIIPETKMKAYKTPPKTLPRSPGHHREWINACKGGPAPGSNFSFAGPLVETVLLGNIALLAGQKLYWDSKNMNFANAPDADKLLHREYRPGWSL